MLQLLSFGNHGKLLHYLNSAENTQAFKLFGSIGIAVAGYLSLL